MPAPPRDSRDSNAIAMSFPGIPYCVRDERQRIMLKAIEDGRTISDAAKLAGVHRDRYYEWRKIDPIFAAEEARVRNGMVEARRKKHVDRIELLGETGERIVKGLQYDAAKRAGGELTPQVMADLARDESAQRGLALGEKFIADWARIAPPPPPDPTDAPAPALATLDVPGSLDDFIDHDLGPAVIPRAALYSRIEWIVRQLDRPNVKCGVLILGKGSGKSLAAALFLARRLRAVVAHADPAAQLGLMPGEKLGVLNLSVTGDQAQLAIFDSLARFVRQSPYFQKHKTSDLADRVEFTERNVLALSGSSSSKGAEGVSWVACAADEVDRLPETEQHGLGRAKDLVEPVEATMLTRFPRDRKALIMSWPEHPASYVIQRREQARKAGIAEDLTRDFDACPVDRDAQRDVARRAAIAVKPFVDYPVEAFLSADGTLCVTAPTWAMKPDADLTAFALEHAKNEVQFARMLGARPLTVGQNPLIRNVEDFARRANAARHHPVMADGRFEDWFKGSPEYLYYGHLDLGLRHDAAGIAVGHYKEGRCVYDLLWEIKPPSGGELRIRDLLGIFGDMARRGFTFGKVTHDGYQGIAVGQGLEDLSLESELFSVDRDRRAYDTFNTKRLEGALDYYPSEPLVECIRSLIDTGRKIDHVPGGKKDLSDAVAAVCYHVFDSVIGA